MKIYYSKTNFKSFFEYGPLGNCKDCLYFLDMVKQMRQLFLQKCEWGSLYRERKCSPNCLQGIYRQIMIFVIKVWRVGDSMFVNYKLVQVSIKNFNFVQNCIIRLRSIANHSFQHLITILYKFFTSLHKIFRNYHKQKQDYILVSKLHKFSTKIPNLDNFKNKILLQFSISDQQLYLTSKMKGSILRDKKQPNKVEVFQTAKPSKRPHNVKTVEIFMDNLDRQIKESYKKLKKNKDRLASATKQQTLLEETLPHAFSSTLHKTQQSNLCATITTSPPKQAEKVYADASDIVLLDNKEVMDYIYLVYDRYNIKDPMQCSEEGEIERCMTNKKIRKFKDRFQREIGSASTMKNSQLYRSIELNPFLQPKKSLAKKEHSSGVKIEVVSLFSRNQSRNVSKQKEGEQGRSRESTHRMKNQNVLQKKQKIVVTANNRPQNNGSPVMASVPQLFRFCFMCEEPILECNLVSHQKSCESLKKAMLYSFEELLSILNKKINRLVEQINSQLLQKTEQRIKEEFMRIKLSVKNWLNQLPFERTNSMYKKQGGNWRGQFTNIEQNISNSVCSSFHLLHKLQWFTKLHQNITKNVMGNK